MLPVFFRCQHANMISGRPSTKDAWSTRESLYHVGLYAELMSLRAFQDMYRCLNFADDWEEDAYFDWELIYLNKRVQSLSVAKHYRTVGMVTDAFNKHWKELVTYGLHITFDTRRVAR